MLSPADLLAVQVALRPDGDALVWADTTLTYALLDAESAQVANALAASGIGRADRVAILARNIPEYFTMLFGTMRAGAVLVPVSWRLAPAEIAYIVEHAAVKELIVEADLVSRLTAAALPAGVQVIVVGNSDEHTTYADWISSQSTTAPAIATAETDTVLQLYTSGTTGRPKGAELTNRNIVATLRPFREMLGLVPESVMLHVLPMFHIAGCAVALAALSAGCRNIVLRQADPAAILAGIAHHRVTTTFLVPALLQALPQVPGATEFDVSSLELMFYGASPIAEDILVGSMALLGCPHAQAYGLTETTGALTLLAAEDHDPGGPRAHLIRSAGRPMAGVEIRIVGPNGEDSPAGEAGEIWCRSEQNLKGYWRDAAATAAAFPESVDERGVGWFRTGDAGRLDDGYLYILDRLKDMIISGAENIYPAEVESALLSHPGVADVAVIGIASERWGESPLAFVVPAEGSDPTDDELLDHCRQRLASFKIPQVIERVDVLPRNASGKILKTELRNRVAGSIR